jgi:hypothetical protein
MTREDIIRMAREAAQMPQWSDRAITVYGLRDITMLERFAALVAAAERNKLAQWMINCSYATGHGDTVEDLLKELEWQVRESERNACAAIARQWDVDHQGSNYGGCIARLIEARGQA